MSFLSKLLKEADTVDQALSILDEHIEMPDSFTRAARGADFFIDLAKELASVKKRESRASVKINNRKPKVVRN